MSRYICPVPYYCVCSLFYFEHGEGSREKLSGKNVHAMPFDDVTEKFFGVIVAVIHPHTTEVSDNTRLFIF